MADISILYFLQLALKRIWALIIVGVIFAAAAFGYCKYLATPQYVSRASIVITNGTFFIDAYTQEISSVNSIKGSDISSSLSIIDTAIDVLKTPELYQKLQKESPYGSNYSYGSLMSMTSISKREGNTLFVDLAFRSTEPKHAVSFVNQFAELSCDYLSDYIPFSNAKVASKASGASKIYPETSKTVLTAALIGAVVAYLAVLLVDIMDKAIKGEEEFVAHYDIPLIGVIPDFENGVILSSGYKKRRYGSYVD